MLTSEELERYARHIVLREVGGPGQAALKASRVLVNEGFIVLPYVTDDPVTCKKLEDIGLEIIASTPEQLAAVQKADLDKWSKPVKATGYQAD